MFEGQCRGSTTTSPRVKTWQRGSMRGGASAVVKPWSETVRIEPL